METIFFNPLQKFLMAPAPALAATVTPFSHNAVESIAKYSLPEFKKITPEDMPLIWKYLKREKGRTTDFSYGGLLMWVDYFNYEFCIYRDTLFIKGLVENDRSCPAFSMPVGSMDLGDAVKVLKSYSSRHNIDLEFSAVPEYAISEFEKLNPTKIEPLDDWSDYLYPAEKLATLSGKKMSKKRNHVNRFMELNPDYSLSPLNADNLQECLDFLNIYDSQLDDAEMGREESVLARKMIELTTLGDPVMHGAVLRDNTGRVVALAVGDVKDDTLFVHIEKADRNVAGSYEMINKEFASYMCAKYPEIKYINREDDGGDPGLRNAKQSYHPCELLKKYNIIF